MKNNFWKGVRHGIPIALGYLSVSFGFGITAYQLGLSLWAALGISATNVTSAGQAAGIQIIAAGGALTELILTELIINLRYALMGIALTQRLGDGFTLGHRLAVAFGITDEIFAVASVQDELLSPSYMYGMILIAWIGWTGGTALGAVAGDILPATVTAALGVLLYGMFIAIIIPPAKKDKAVLFTVLAAAALSVLLFYAFPKLSSGFSVILVSVPVAALMALLFPRDDNASDGEAPTSKPSAAEDSADKEDAL